MLKLTTYTLPCITTGILFVAIALQTSVAAQTKNAAAHIQSNEQARQLWEASIAAKGGRERLRNISSLFVKADQGRGYRQSIFHAFPRYTFDYSYAPNRESTVILLRNAKLERISHQCKT